MNRRGFLRAVGAAWLALSVRGLAVGVVDATPKLAPRTMKTETVIQQAMRERRTLQFRYHGFSRRVEPHALGLLAEDRSALLAWQTAGGSATEPPPGWRTFVVAEMEKVKLHRETFAPRPDFDPQTTPLKSVVAAVAKERPRSTSRP